MAVSAKAVDVQTSRDVDHNLSADLLFDDVFTQHASFVMRTLIRLGVPDAEVDDISQEVFLIVHKKLDTYNRKCSLRTWIFGILRRVASDFFRRAHVRREYVTESPPEQSICGEEVERRAQIVLMQKALDQLTEKQRSIFILFELEGFSIEEAAQAVGCPKFTAYTRLRSARIKVKKIIENELEDRGGHDR